MLNAQLYRFWSDERGAETVEWAVVTAVLLFATAVAVFAVKDELLDVFRTAFQSLQPPPPASY